jgi:hypothetical protein
MKIQFEIVRASVITGVGPDRVFLFTNYAGPFRHDAWELLTLEFTAARGNGLEYCVRYLGINPEVVNR